MKDFSVRGVWCLLVLIISIATPLSVKGSEQTAATQDAAVRSVGTVKAISGNTITLTTESGGELSVTLVDGARLLRVEPGAKDLKSAVPLTLQEILPGDRILIRGKLSGDGKSMQAVSVIAMKKEDIAARRTREREEWQSHSVGGLVTNVDPAANTVTIANSAAGTTHTVVVRVSKDTILRRYAPGSVKFDDAKPASLDQVKVSDQLRARGTRSADGNDLTADEIVSGTFRNFAGTISSTDTGAGTLIISDLATKQPVVVKITAESQLRKLPPEMAQRIAARLKGPRGETVSPGNTSGQAPSGNANASGGAAHADGSAGSRGAPDLQLAINRMPAATLADLQKGEAVMVVAAPGAQDSGLTAITLLAGVEPILEASPKEGQSILSPWSLSGAPGGEATP
jgi:hypothetical protein